METVDNGKNPESMELPPKLYKIGEIMYYTGLSRQVLHHYTQLGLIKETARTPSGHRLYDGQVFLRLKRIKELKAQGLNLLQIRDVLDREFTQGDRSKLPLDEDKENTLTDNG